MFGGCLHKPVTMGKIRRSWLGWHPRRFDLITGSLDLIDLLYCSIMISTLHRFIYMYLTLLLSHSKIQMLLPLCTKLIALVFVFNLSANSKDHKCWYFDLQNNKLLTMAFKSYSSGHFEFIVNKWPSGFKYLGQFWLAFKRILM